MKPKRPVTGFSELCSQDSFEIWLLLSRALNLLTNKERIFVDYYGSLPCGRPLAVCGATAPFEPQVLCLLAGGPNQKDPL